MDLKENQEKFFTYDRVHPWETVRLSFVETLLRKYNPGAKRVLDVGCGNCFVANSLTKKFRIKIAAVDNMFTPELMAKLRGQPVVQGIELFRSVEDIHDMDFDTVMLLDVIEHIEDDKTALRELLNSDRIKPGAVFIITVPAFSALFSEHDRRLGHYRRYTASQLCRLAGESGTEILDYGYFWGIPWDPAHCQLIRKTYEIVKKYPEFQENINVQTLYNLLNKSDSIPIKYKPFIEIMDTKFNETKNRIYDEKQHWIEDTLLAPIEVNEGFRSKFRK